MVTLIAPLFLDCALWSYFLEIELINFCQQTISPRGLQIWSQLYSFLSEKFFKNEWYFLEPILSLKQPNFDQNVKHMFETCKNIIANIDGPSPTIWSGSTQDLIRCCHIKHFYILQTLALTTQICLLWHIEGDFQNRRLRMAKICIRLTYCCQSIHSVRYIITESQIRFL